jgi:hypothetical protein
MNIGKLFRAKDEKSVPDKLSLYFPNRDRNKRHIDDIDTWIEGAAHLMATINGGCTQMPAARAMWHQDDIDITVEDTTVIYSLLLRPDSFKANFEEKIVKYFHAFGRETDQHTLFAEMSYFDGTNYIQECYEIPHTNYLPAQK